MNTGPSPCDVPPMEEATGTTGIFGAKGASMGLGDESSADKCHGAEAGEHEQRGEANN